MGSGIWSRLRPNIRALDIHRALLKGRSERHADVERLSAYHRELASSGDGDMLDERTCADLDLDEVFFTCDSAASEPGRQVLYAQLRRPELSETPLLQREGAIAACSSDPQLAERIRASVRSLADRRAARLVDLFFAKLPVRPPLWWCFPLLTLISLASVGIVWFYPPVIVVIVLMSVVNLVIGIAFKPRVERFIPAIHELPAFIGAAEELSAITHPAFAAQAEVLRAASGMRGLRSASTWLMFEPSQTNELAAALYGYVNLLFLLDVNAFVFATERIRREQPRLRELFRALGEVDAVQSVALWREQLPWWTTPAFLPQQKRLVARELVHPLLEAPVANPIEVNGTSVLVTGSNMSGKTTFIRTLGVNAILAQTLHTVCAERWEAPFLIVRTSIGRSDNLLEGKSYYLAEAESILALIRAKEAPGQRLFLLDEIFRGTNTSERVAAAHAVLKHLTEGDDLVVVATHDVELLELLGASYASHHFAEQVSEDALSFDYRIKSGPSSTRNAIALLRFMKYPDAVVTDALATLDARERSK